MIVIGWKELPSYAVDCINYLNLKDKLIVLTDNKRGNYLIKKSKVKIINLNKKYTWKSLGIKNPKYFFFTGWNNKAFITLARQKITKNICLIDNVLKKNIRQFFGKFYFKFFLNNLFDAIFLPGKNSINLMNYFGFKKTVLDGMYTCNNLLFRNKKNLLRRKYDFIFVGKFIKRKNIHVLLKAFEELKKVHKNSNLLLIGGKLKINKKRVKTISYKKSKDIAEYMNKAKCLILPSLEDNWGVVVHEGICSGCLLILSNKVGSKKEFLNKNGFEFEPKNYQDLYSKMKKIKELNKKSLMKKSKISIKISKIRSMEKWKSQFFKFIKE